MWLRDNFKMSIESFVDNKEEILIMKIRHRLETIDKDKTLVKY